jgi:hypothetical protein
MSHDSVDYVNLGSEENSFILLNLTECHLARSEAAALGENKSLLGQRLTCK